MKVLFKKYKVNPIIKGPCHVANVGRIDFDDISEETLEILHTQGLLEGHVTLLETESTTTEGENQSVAVVIPPRPRTKPDSPK